VDISPLEYIKENYKNEVYDEFFKPVNFTANTIES
jgi:bisphosphoglycerate-independent phosphoglycerate mutase (AlkP superfamily)